MLFRKLGCLVGPENSIFRKLKSVDPKKMPLTTEISLHFYFPFKAFPKNERERESARARQRRSVRRRDRAVDRDLAVDRDRQRREIAISPSRSQSHRIEIAIDGAITDVFFWGVACVFLNLCFPSFPNTRKYFQENFLKCNQTQRNIFLFRKLAFPENIYFPENVLQQPNTA